MCYPQGDSDDQLPRGRLVDDLGGGLDVAQLAGGEVGGRDEPEVAGYEDAAAQYPANNWLVPGPGQGRVDETKLKKNFDPDTVAASVVPR